MGGLQVDHGPCQAAGRECAMHEQAGITHCRGSWGWRCVDCHSSDAPVHQSSWLKTHGQSTQCLPGPPHAICHVSSPRLRVLPPAFQKALTTLRAAAVAYHSPASGGQHGRCCSFLKALGLPPESPGASPTGWQSTHRWDAQTLRREEGACAGVVTSAKGRCWIKSPALVLVKDFSILLICRTLPLFLFNFQVTTCFSV